MFETFKDCTKLSPEEQKAAEWKAAEATATAQEILKIAKAKGIALTVAESSRSCMGCVHWAFVSTDPDSVDDRRCHKLPPVPDACGDGQWPRTTDADFCDSHRPIQTSAHQGLGEGERRRLLLLYHVKLAAERKDTAGKGRKR